MWTLPELRIVQIRAAQTFSTEDHIENFIAIGGEYITFAYFTRTFYIT